MYNGYNRESRCLICSDYNYGENWTFSTLNAPGWLEGDSYDGFHPVSGNRQFGIIDNGDGTFFL